MKCKTSLLYIILLLIFSNTIASASVKTINQALFKTINSDGDETSCSLTSNKKTIYFARKPKGAQSSDLFYSEYKKGKWSVPKQVGELNSESDDISPFISPDGQFILFASNRNGSLKSSNGSRLSYDIYFSEKKKGKWEKPELLFGAVNTSDDETFPSITGDRKSLYFTRTTSDENPKSSIIKVNKKDDYWEDVNTADITNETNYKFSMAVKSSYRPGYIFTAFRNDSATRDIFFSFSSNENKGKVTEDSALNTPGDDISFFEVSSRGIIVSSNDKGIDGSYDLSLRKISQTIRQNTTQTDLQRNISVKAEFKNYDNSENAQVNILYFKTKKTGIKPFKTELKKLGKEDGINLEFSAGIKRILILPGNDDMKSFALEIFPGTNLLTRYITIEKKIPAEFKLRDVYFDFNSSVLKLEYIPYMQELIGYLRKSEKNILTINGYADSVGTCRANNTISLKRAENIKEYLVNHGIKAERIKTSAQGYKMSNAKDTAQYNRRVEFSINE